MRSRTKWMIGGGLAAVVSIAGAGGVALAGGGAFDDDEPLTGEALADATAAALAEAGDGEVIDADRDDGRYEVEIRRADGTVVEVDLDDSFAVVGSTVEDDVDRDDGDGPDDDRMLTGDELDRVTAAALAETGGGTVTDAERDGDGTYEVEVRQDDGREVDLRLAEDLSVISSGVDDERDDD